MSYAIPLLSGPTSTCLHIHGAAAISTSISCFQLAGENRQKSYRERRRITRQADEALPDGFRVEGNLILPESFVNYKLVEALFGNARDYLFCVLKNVEAQVELALAYGESPHMSDDELYKTTMQLCRTMFGKQSPQDLDEQQRKEMAVRLKTRYYASNGQLARFTGLAITTINTLFPLSAKPH